VRGIAFWGGVLHCVIMSQGISYGPVVGAVTDTSARIFCAFNSMDTAHLVVYGDTNYNIPAMSLWGIPRPSFDTSFIFDIRGLQPGTWYGYKVFQGGDTAYGKFRTFKYNDTTDQYPFKIAFGSCIGYTDSLFALIATYNPHLTVIIGDWGYYDYPIDSPTISVFFPDDWNNLMLTWQKRYTMPVLKNYIRNHAMAYTWSDHDFAADGACQFSATYYDTANIKLDTVPYNAMTTTHSRWGYINMFPHYELIDSTDGIYQKIYFPYGEGFLIDYRSRKDAYAKAFVKQGTNWTFMPPPGHTTLGIKQRQWLFNGITSSSSCWKIIFSDNVFNKKFRHLMNVLFSKQSINPFYALAAMGLGEWWCGYPYDQDTLLHLINTLNIKGVMICSGDIHTAAMDDGTNAGIPEAIACALGQTNSMIAQLIQLAGENPSAYFNKGAQGIPPNNTDNTNAFGLLEIYGCDSLVAKLINQNNNIIARMTLYNPLQGIEPPEDNTKEHCSNENLPLFYLGMEGKILDVPPSHSFFTIQLYHDTSKDTPVICKKVILPRK